MYHDVSVGSHSGIPTLIGSCYSCSTEYKMTVIGEIYNPVVGERYRLWGEWRDNPKYRSRDFHFHSFEVISENSIPGIVDYFARYVPELGAKLSRQIADHFGAENCLKIVRTSPGRLKEIKGIGPHIVNAIIEHFDQNSCPVDPETYASVYNLFSEDRPPNKIIIKIINDFGSSAFDIIKENPYILLGYAGVGWTTVDRIAIKKLKYKSDGIERQISAINEIMTKCSNDGDTVVDLVDIECRASKELGVNLKKESLQEAVKQGNIVEISTPLANGRTKKQFAIADLWNAEQEIAHRLKMLSDSVPDDLPEIDTTGLDDEQIEACEFIRRNPVCILTGPPGTGKTVSITKVVETLHRLGTVVFVAPTGKAAKRAGEVLDKWIPNNDVLPSTIHRALSPVVIGGDLGIPQENAKFGRERERFAFSHHEENPIPLDFAIADEVSMIDVPLFLSFLRAIPHGARLILVGDENQLPSVGPGATLRDMIAGGVPTFSLVKPRRNSGMIVLACHSVKDGKVPQMADEIDLENGKNIFHFESPKMEQSAQIIVDLHDCTDRDKMWDLQIISPQNGKLPVACENLNNLLSAKLNPKGKRSELQSKYDKWKIGDKIVRTKNAFVDQMVPNFETGEDLSFVDFDCDFIWNEKPYSLSKTYIVNGDIGQVKDVIKFSRNRYVIVQFRNPDRLCCLPASEAYIDPAYCTTCHKAQGSGFPVVILPVHNAFHWNSRTDTGLWCRELFFTEVSRGIDLVITVGEFSAIRAAVSRKTIHKRKTSLASFINKEFKK